jgi:hypothetical protein
MKTKQTATANDELGMVWWNRLSKKDRAEWLQVAGSARPVDAWRAFQSGKIKTQNSQ